MGGPMGMSGGLANMTPAEAYKLQQAFSPAAQSVPWGTYQPPEKVFPTVVINAAEEKLRAQMRKMIDALPVSVCHRITRVEFYPSFVQAGQKAKFVVVFSNDKHLEFEDVDEFPSDAHLATIGLCCP